MYKKITLSFDKIPQLSSRDQAYQMGEDALGDFYQYEVALSSFQAIAKAKKEQKINRPLIVRELERQYADLSEKENVLQNIRALGDEHTFTIITAHQPSLLTGPLYFIYKICSVISLARQLNEHYADFKVVPAFILGGEDHDFEEIATMNLFGQDFTWETDQKGSTGRMSLDGVEKVLTQVKERFGQSTYAGELSAMIDEAFSQSKSYGEFMFRLVHSLFGSYGLVIINMDNAEFKKEFLPYVLRDLRNEDSRRSVQKDQEALEEAGFKGQAHARKVNIFWMDGDRHRVIDLPDGRYEIDGKAYSQEELASLLTANPGAISPNVILRPAYQEVVLPNLAYIGGGGELAYWLERKTLFDEWNIPFPMLIRRDSALIVDKRSNNWLESVGLHISDLFDRQEQIVGKYAQIQAPVDIDLSAERKAVHNAFERIKTLAAQVDPTLKKTVLSEEAKSQKSLDYLENKILKAEKQKNEVGINKLRKIKQKFFPGNDSLQERHDNFIPFYLRYGQAWIDTLIDELDPLDKDFKILIEE